MSSFKKFFLSSIVAFSMVLSPYIALASDWAPPTGLPPYYNTPAPVNVGPAGQTKAGSLYISQEGGVGLAAPFSNAAFGTNSNGVDAPSTIKLYGSLLYQPSGFTSPTTTSVLSPDSEGKAVWKEIDSFSTTGIPPGNTTGDTLYWVCSTTGSGSGSPSSLLQQFEANQTQELQTFKDNQNQALQQFEDDQIKALAAVGAKQKQQLIIQQQQDKKDFEAQQEKEAIDFQTKQAQAKEEFYNTIQTPTKANQKAQANQALAKNLPVPVSQDTTPTPPIGTPGTTTNSNPSSICPDGEWKVSSSVKIQPGNTTIFQAFGGGDNGIKVDTHGKTFINNALNVTLSNSEGVDTTGKVLAGVNGQGDVEWADLSDLIPGGGGGGDGTLPSGAQGQTFWYNNGNWEATSKINHTADDTNLFSKNINVGQLGWSDGPIDTQKTSVYSPTVIFGDPAAANAGSIGSGGQSPTPAWSQNVTFYSPSVKFANNSISPAQGRFLYSTTSDGKVAWNKYLTSEAGQMQIPGAGGQPVTIDVNTIRINEFSGQGSNVLSLFRNDGFTQLNGPTVVNDSLGVNGATTLGNTLKVTGETTLVTVPTPPVGTNPNTLKPLCVNSNNLVVSCKPQDAAPTFQTDDYVYNPSNNGQSLTVTNPGTVHVEWCGGGGGGGGGGIGQPGPNNNSDGAGGGGGGGGERGECQSQDVNVQAGDVITWNVGAGGNGGDRAQYYTYMGVDGYYEDTSKLVATHGQGGQSTVVYLNGSPIGETAFGGNPGLHGCSFQDLGTVDGGDLYCATIPATRGGAPGGSGGNILLSSDPNQYWWHSGTAGIRALGYGSNPAGMGGQGGNGEAIWNNQSLYTPCNDNGASGETPENDSCTDSVTGSSWGAQGVFDHKYGYDGTSGKFANGGGGGGGGFGNFIVSSPNQTWTINGTTYFSRGSMEGGYGGGGGDGYVKIVGVSGTGNSNSNFEDFSYTGNHSFDLRDLPSNISGITFEMWGAGGGGQALTTAGINSGVLGSGGGAGGYAKFTVPVSANVQNCLSGGSWNTGSSYNNICTINVHVGQRGMIGEPNPANDGEATTLSGQSYVMYSLTGSINTPYSVGGGKAPTNGNGGNGGNSPALQNGGGLPPATNVTNIPGAAGQEAGLGGNGAQGHNSIGNGGKGAKVTNVGGINQQIPGSSGTAGRVKISWQ